MRLIAIVVALGLGVITIAGCEKSPPPPPPQDLPMHFIVPNKFRGEFYIILDEKKGKPPTSTAGQYQLHVPLDRKIYLTELLSVRGMTAQYADGRAIPTDDDLGSGDGETIALRFAGMILGTAFEGPTMIFVIGTADELPVLEEIERPATEPTKTN